MSDERPEQVYGWKELRAPEPLCANCGHTKEAHWDRYGCQVEGPDVWVEGNNCGALMTSGPCGCTNWMTEQSEFACLFGG